MEINFVLAVRFQHRHQVTTLWVCSGRTIDNRDLRWSRERGEACTMLFELSSDQEFFRETTARYLAERAPATELRRLQTDPVGYGPELWRGGAELGWTSLLVSDAHGGGSISGRPVVDLSLLAHELGFAAGPGPFLPTNIVASALSAAGDRHVEVVGELLAGTETAAWCYAEAPPADRLGVIATTVRPDGDELVIDGVKRPVEFAGSARHLLVVGQTGDGITQVLVPADAVGVVIEPMKTVDLTRRFSKVVFDGVRVPASAAVGDVGGATDAVERQLQLALVIVNAESVGAMQRVFDMTVEWAFDRYSFGRPLASYQALKHRFADMKMWLEASHAISDDAAAAVQDRTGEAAELVSIAKAYIGEMGSELMQDCVQIHGGIGVTSEHDLHLYLRRHTVDRAMYGTPADHRRRIADMVVARELAA
jgi:alkylation response protein AidB-like acyl-CoA dehydrogenase